MPCCLCKRISHVSYSYQIYGKIKDAFCKACIELTLGKFSFNEVMQVLILKMVNPIDIEENCKIIMNLYGQEIVKFRSENSVVEQVKVPEPVASIPVVEQVKSVVGVKPETKPKNRINLTQGKVVKIENVNDFGETFDNFRSIQQLEKENMQISSRVRVLEAEKGALTQKITDLSNEIESLGSVIDTQASIHFNQIKDLSMKIQELTLSFEELKAKGSSEDQEIKLLKP